MSEPSTHPPGVLTWHRLFGHGFALVIGLGVLACAIAGLAAGVPPPLSLFCLVSAGAMFALIPQSLRGSRAAWSVLVAMLAVDALGTFFGAGPLSRALHVNLGVALLVPLALTVDVIALAV